MQRSSRFATAFLVVVLAMSALSGCVATYPFQGDVTLLLTPVPPGEGVPEAVATALASAETSAGPAETRAATPAGAPTAIVSTRSLRVRLAPTTDSPMIFGLRDGESYQVVGTNQDETWLELQIPGLEGTGWVFAELVTVEGDVVGLPITTPLGVATVHTEGARLRVRNDASTEADIVGYLLDGATYNVLARSEDGEWLLLDIPDIEGPTWVAAEYTAVEPVS